VSSYERLPLTTLKSGWAGDKYRKIGRGGLVRGLGLTQLRGSAGRGLVLTQLRGGAGRGLVLTQLRGSAGRGLVLTQLWEEGGGRNRPANENVAKLCPTRNTISNINDASSHNIILFPSQDFIIYVKGRFLIDRIQISGIACPVKGGIIRRLFAG
jgi:hypothetical protein